MTDQRDSAMRTWNEADLLQLIDYEAADPMNRSQFRKERLEHIIGTICPRIEGIHI